MGDKLGGTNKTVTQDLNRNNFQQFAGTTSPLMGQSNNGGLLDFANTISPQLTGNENAALSGLNEAGKYSSQFLPATTGLANSLLAGGGANSFAPMFTNANTTLQG